MKRFWPELVILFLGLWFGAIFGLTDDRIMAYRLTGDSLLSPYFYDHVSRALTGAVSFEWLTEFNYPKPKNYTIEFPSFADAVIFSPIHWIFDWPQQWNLTLHAYILVNGLSMAMLARVLGFGPFGILMAGMCGLWFRAPYVDMAKGRIQTVGIGFFVLSLATTLGLFRDRLDGIERRLRTRQIYWVASVLSSGVAAVIYPPFLILLLPLAGILYFGHTPKRSDFLWLGSSVALVSTVTAWPLYRMAQIRQFHDGELQCPSAYNVLQPEHLATTTSELLHHGIPFVMWLAIPAVFIICQNRKMWVMVIAVSLVCIGLSMGPCLGSEERVDFILPGVHRLFLSIQDWGRLATVGTIGLSLVLAAGVSQLSERNRYWGLAVVPIGLLLFLPILNDLKNPNYWHPIPRSFYQEFMASKAPTTAVVFPFESSQTLLDGLALPQHRMVNPLRSQDPPDPEHNPSIRWMFELGKGNPNPTEPTAKGFQKLGVEWVFFDPARCETVYRYHEACAGHVQRSLKAELGKGEPAESGVVIWQLR